MESADLGVIIGLIGTVCIAGMLALSYVGAYLMGHSRGRREAERELRALERDEARLSHADRLLVVEGAVDSVARAVERLTDAQRIILLEQARAAEAAPAEPRLSAVRTPTHNTPA